MGVYFSYSTPAQGSYDPVGAAFHVNSGLTVSYPAQ